MVLVPDGGQIARLLSGHNLEMEDPNNHRIVEALRLKDGVFITFEDGKCAIYWAALLHAMFPKADQSIREESNGQD